MVFIVEYVEVGSQQFEDGTWGPVEEERVSYFGNITSAEEFEESGRDGIQTYFNVRVARKALGLFWRPANAYMNSSIRLGSSKYIVVCPD